MFLRVPSLLNDDELARLVAGLCEGPFEDGRATAGPLASRAKQNRQLAAEAPQRAALERIVFEALMRDERIQKFSLPHHVFGLVFNRYEAGARYGAHVDNALMQADAARRTDLSVTVFLTPPDAYDGGELVIEDLAGTARLKLGAGDAVLYPATTLHEVAPVTRGVRLAAVAWIQSHVRDAAQRVLLHDLTQVRQTLEASAPDARETLVLAKVYGNLLRMWADA